MAGTSIAIRWQGSQHTSSQDAPLATEENDSAQGNSIKFNGGDMRAAGVGFPFVSVDHRRSVIIAWVRPAWA